jgi:hypothetical protein
MTRSRNAPSDEQKRALLHLLDVRSNPTMLARARFKFRHWCAKIEQACEQQRPANQWEVMEMEIAAVREIAEIFGVKLNEEGHPVNDHRLRI